MADLSDDHLVLENYTLVLTVFCFCDHIVYRNYLLMLIEPLLLEVSVYNVGLYVLWFVP